MIGSPDASQAVAAAAGDPAAEGVPPEVLAAVGRGDFGGLVEVLRREHARRSGDPVTPAGAAPEPVRDASAPTAAFDRETVEAMLQLAADNGVTPDWVVHRAIKLYVEEHRKTGRL